MILYFPGKSYQGWNTIKDFNRLVELIQYLVGFFHFTDGNFSKWLKFMTIYSILISYPIELLFILVAKPETNLRSMKAIPLNLVRGIS